MVLDHCLVSKLNFSRVDDHSPQIGERLDINGFGSAESVIVPTDIGGTPWVTSMLLDAADP
jgi:hypothetical protein